MSKLGEQDPYVMGEATNPSKEPMYKGIVWEYLTIDFSDIGLFNFEVNMNTLGSVGWELTVVNKNVAVFKRQKQ